MEKITFAPAYVAFYPMLAEIARNHHYTLAIHGSIGKNRQSDFDLVAIPWNGEASSEEELTDAIWEYAIQVMPSYFDGFRADKWHGTNKPHGRRAWKLQIGNGAAIDISIMPRMICDTCGGSGKIYVSNSGQSREPEFEACEDCAQNNYQTTDLEESAAHHGGQDGELGGAAGHHAEIERTITYFVAHPSFSKSDRLIVRRAIYQWIAKHGTREQGLREAAEVCRLEAEREFRDDDYGDACLACAKTIEALAKELREDNK